MRPRNHAYDSELSDHRVRYAMRYENEGRPADRAASIADRAARAMRDGDRYIDGSARDGHRHLTHDSQPGAGREQDKPNPQAGGSALRRFRELRGLAWCVSGRGDWQAAISHLAEARDMLPARHMARGGLDRAITALWNRTLENDPRTPDVRTAAGPAGGTSREAEARS